jgi:hypothetical protein
MTQSKKIQVHHKFKIVEVLDKQDYAKEKAHMNIPFCRMMISMLVLKSTLKIDVLKMEQAFHMRYREGDKVLYMFATNWEGEEAIVDAYEEG